MTEKAAYSVECGYPIQGGQMGWVRFGHIFTNHVRVCVRFGLKMMDLLSVLGYFLLWFVIYVTMLECNRLF